jgi:hypothetical protein
MKASLTKRIAIDQSILKWEYVKTHIKAFELRTDLEHFEFPDNTQYIHGCPMCTYASEHDKGTGDLAPISCYYCPLAIFWAKTCDKKFGKAFFFYWKRSPPAKRLLMCETILDALYAIRKGQLKDRRGSSLPPYLDVKGDL